SIPLAVHSWHPCCRCSPHSAQARQRTTEAVAVSPTSTPREKPEVPPLALLQAEQRRRWRLGGRGLVEAFLDDSPALASTPQVMLDLIYQEICLRTSAGETPQLDEYLRRFPSLADDLRRQFEVHAFLERTMPDDPAPDRTEECPPPSLLLPPAHFLDPLARHPPPEPDPPPQPH